jgi:TIR domain
VRLFISYAHVDKSDALYVRSIIESISFQFYEPVEISGKTIATTGTIAGVLGTLALPNVVPLLAASFGVSYLFSSREEKEHTKWLIREAKRRVEKRLSTTEIKLMAWMDNDISIGDDWYSEIQSAIETSDAFVLLVPDVASVNVGIECGIAVTYKKKIILIARSVDHLSRYNLSQQQALTWPDSGEEWKTTFAETLVATSKSILEKEYRNIKKMP